MGFVILGQDLVPRELGGIALVVAASAGASATAEPVAEPAEPPL
jgi:threonine/homoserine efflux transporter RhtA